MYCTITQARAAGAVGTDAEVTAAIGVARTLIDRYTLWVWEPTATTVVARVAPDGTVQLPLPVRTITSVTPVGAGTPAALPASGYLALSSNTPGQVDAVILGGQGWADPLIAGAEPWNGGYANLYAGLMSGTGQVTVVGMFGPDAVPPEVQDSAAALAAWRTTGGSLLPVPASAGNPQTDDEGNVVSITVDATGPAVRTRTTGLPAVDALLAQLPAGYRLRVS